MKTKYSGVILSGSEVFSGFFKNCTAWRKYLVDADIFPNMAEQLWHGQLLHEQNAHSALIV